MGYHTLKEIFKGLDDEQYQPNSIDLKLGKVYKSIEHEYMKVGLYNGEKHLPNLDEIKPKYHKEGVYDTFLLSSKVPYWFEIEPIMEIPNDMAQFYLPRSSLLRMGITLHTALGDSGFKGHLRFLAINHNKYPVLIQKGERVATAINFPVCESIAYDGDYNEK